MPRTIAIHLILSTIVLCSTSFGMHSATSNVELVRIHRAGNRVRIELTLSAAVVPDITRTSDPDRLVMELPQTSTVTEQHTMTVNYGSVDRVRIGLHQTNPPSARVVCDLNSAGPYELSVQGRMVILTVLPARVPPARSIAVRSRTWFQKTTRRPEHKTAEINPSPGMPVPTPSSPLAFVVTPAAQVPRISFRIKYIADGVAYLGGGGNAGLQVGMKLTVWDGNPPLPNVRATPAAQLLITSVADSSALTEVHVIRREVHPGDWAYLSAEDSARLQKESSGNTPTPRASLLRSAPHDDKLHPRETVPVDENRMNGRVALDYSGIRSHGSTPGSSSELGLSFRSDMTNIAGTHWNLQGYWRGRLTQNSQATEQTIQDYLDRTYTLQLYYNNPDSKWLAGVGRLYLPWAVSLDTVDGGYLGRRVAHGVIAGAFAGSTPDPTSWRYRPDQQVAGTFVNFAGGSYDQFHYSSTGGFGVNLLAWNLDRPFGFFENEISYRTFFSVYHSLIVDSPQGLTTGGIRPGAGISRSYLTFHFQPHPRISFDIYHNYFRDVPTAATQLIGTGLVDKLLYQGLNAGVRVEPIRNISIYTTLGESRKTGDIRRSLNQMYGVTWNDIAHSGFRADLRYSKFDSSFARGDYRLLSLSHQVGNQTFWNAQVGTQSLNSPFTANRGSYFFDTSIDTNLTRRTFLQSGYTIERGLALTYDQWYVSLGYRFDAQEEAGKNLDSGGKSASPAPR